MSVTRWTRRRVLHAMAFTLSAVAASGVPAAAQEDYVVLKSFGSTEGRPVTGLIKATDGHFYGATETETFRLTPAGVYTAINAFGMQNTGGDLIQGSDGHLYGASQTSIVRIALDGTVTVLHTLTPSSDGIVMGSLVEGDDGNFYGMTYGNGSLGLGTLFRVSPAGLFTTLRSLTPAEGGSQGTHLIKGRDGGFYTNFPAGGGGNGTVARIDTSGNIAVLHTFTGGFGGTLPTGLLEASDGNLYGTTSGGGLHNNGIIFRLRPDGLFTVRHSFTGDAGDGIFVPSDPLIEDSAGNLYGTGSRAIFVMAPEGTVRTLHRAHFPAGIRRYGTSLSGVTLGDDGNLYGTAMFSSDGTNGKIFRLNTRRTPCANLVDLAWTTEFGGALTLTTVVKSETPALWGTWLVSEGGDIAQLWASPIATTTPTQVFDIVLHPLPPSGTIGALTILVTSTLDVCADFKSIDTGGGVDSAGRNSRR